MAKRALVAFGDSRLSVARNRLRVQAERLDFFDSIQIFDENELDDLLVGGVREKLRAGIRGFGYWAWKPAVILQALATLDEGDLLLYVDIGCHLNEKGLARLEKYFLLAEGDEKGIVCFQTRPPDGPLVWDGRLLPQYVDAAWAKGDLLDFFGVRHQQDVLLTGTIGAGVILLRNSSFVRQFIDTWLKVMSENWNLVDDSASVASSHPWFLENRHDQAIFSIMAKQANLTTLSAFEYWYPRRRCAEVPDWKALEAFPVHARRDLGSRKKSDMSRWLVRLKIRVKHAIKAFFTCAEE